MAGTHSEVFAASQIVNSVNKQVDGRKGFQMFYDTWPKLSKKKRRKMAYAAVLQSTARMASALSTCTQANAEFVETIRKQEALIKLYEGKHHSCETRTREREEEIARLRADLQQCTNPTPVPIHTDVQPSLSCKQCATATAIPKYSPIPTRVGCPMMHTGMTEPVMGYETREMVGPHKHVPIQSRSASTRLHTSPIPGGSTRCNIPEHRIVPEARAKSITSRRFTIDGSAPLPCAMLDTGISSKEEELAVENAKMKKKHAELVRELEKAKNYSSTLAKEVQTQQREYVELQNSRVASNREQLKVIEYLQDQLQKSNGSVASLKSDVDALHTEKHHMLNYMSHKLNTAQTDAGHWRTLHATCAETMRNVSEIPEIVNNVQDDIKKLQTQMEIQRQRSDASSNLDPNDPLLQSIHPTSNDPHYQPPRPTTTNVSYNNCNCTECAAGNYDECVYSISKLLKELNTNENKHVTPSKRETWAELSPLESLSPCKCGIGSVSKDESNFTAVTAPSACLSVSKYLYSKNEIPIPDFIPTSSVTQFAANYENPLTYLSRTNFSLNKHTASMKHEIPGSCIIAPTTLNSVTGSHDENSQLAVGSIDQTASVSLANNLRPSVSALHTKVSSLSKSDISVPNCLIYTNKLTSDTTPCLTGDINIPNASLAQISSKLSTSVPCSALPRMRSKLSTAAPYTPLARVSSKLSTPESSPRRHRSFTTKIRSDSHLSKSLNTEYKICTFSDNSYTKVFRSSSAKPQRRLKNRPYEKSGDSFGPYDPITQRINDCLKHIGI